MDLDKMAAELRRRQGAGSIDLGLLLGRRFYGSVLKPWLILVVPTLILVQLAVALVINPVVAVVVAWWLKPLFDRVTLHVISRGFFGTIPAPRQTVRAVARQWISWEAVKDLSWRRLSPARTMTMPIRVLEGMRGRRARERIKSLYGSGVRPGEQLGLLSSIVGFKWLFYFGLATLAVLVVPVELVDDPLALLQYVVEDADEAVQIAVLIGATTVATTLAEPFFGAGGFGLYIQRRIEREGWDLELRFRRLAERVTSSLDGTVGLWLAAGLAALLAGSAVNPAPAHADEPLSEREARLVGDDGDASSVLDELEAMDDDALEQFIDGADSDDITPAFGDDQRSPTADDLIDDDQIPVDDPAATLEEQMDESPFANRTETRTTWVPKEEDDDDGGRFLEWLDELFSDVDGGSSGLSDGLSLMGALLRVLMWILVIAIVGFALWKIFQYIEGRRGGQTVTDQRATRWKEELVDDGDELVIPDDGVGRQVRRMWAAGDRRRAMAVLLVSSLVRFEERKNYRFRAGWTTSRCAREVRSARPEGPVLARVARSFDALAWAGRPPDDDEFEALVSRWERVFESPGGAP